MHVNSYFIETLVLCFSCGCDKSNLNFDHPRDIPNQSTQCSLNSPLQMIVQKGIHWSSTSSGPPVTVDLEAIKTIVELQFAHANLSGVAGIPGDGCKENTPGWPPGGGPVPKPAWPGGWMDQPESPEGPAEGEGHIPVHPVHRPKGPDDPEGLQSAELWPKDPDTDYPYTPEHWPKDPDTDYPYTPEHWPKDPDTKEPHTPAHWPKDPGTKHPYTPEHWPKDPDTKEPYTPAHWPKDPNAYDPYTPAHWPKDPGTTHPHTPEHWPKGPDNEGLQSAELWPKDPDTGYPYTPEHWPKDPGTKHPHTPTHWPKGPDTEGLESAELWPQDPDAYDPYTPAHWPKDPDTEYPYTPVHWPKDPHTEGPYTPAHWPQGPEYEGLESAEHWPEETDSKHPYTPAHWPKGPDSQGLELAEHWPEDPGSKHPNTPTHWPKDSSKEPNIDIDEKIGEDCDSESNSASCEHVRPEKPPDEENQMAIWAWILKFFPGHNPPVVIHPKPVEIIVNISVEYEPSQPVATIIIPELSRWLVKNPHGHIIIILIDDEAGDLHTWSQELKQAILHQAIVPTYVLVVDWSEYVHPDYIRTLSYANTIARELAKWIREMRIPFDRLTVIGFGTSAHMAGFIGKYSQQFYSTHVYRIIGLNPIGFGDIIVDPGDRLSPKDALQVIVVYSETTYLGYPGVLGTINVNINDPQSGQPWCHTLPTPQSYVCSHIAALDILLRVVLGEPLYPINNATSEILHGFPFEITLEITGFYVLYTDKEKNPPLQPRPTRPPVLEIQLYILEWLRNIEAGKYLPGPIQPPSPEIHVNISIEFKPPRPISTIQLPDLIDWLNQNPGGHVIVILVNREAGDIRQWVKDLKATIHLHYSVPTYILIIDWSEYLHPDYTQTLSHAKTVAMALVQWMSHVLIPFERLTIIGFGSSAHLAGFIGKYSIEIYHVHVLRIIALNPTGFGISVTEEEDRVSQYDALQVIVIYTEMTHIGYPGYIGTINVVVNDPTKGQPWCLHLSKPERYICSHMAALEILLRVLRGEPLLPEGNGTILHGFPFDVILEITGVFIIRTEEENKPSQALEEQTEPPNFENKPPIQFWIVEVPPVEVPEFPPVQPAWYLLFNHNSSSIATMTLEDLPEWLRQNPHGHVIIIVINNEAGDPDEWSNEMQDAIRQHYSVPTYIIVIDWSKYVYPDYVKTISFAKAIARELNKWFKHVLLPLDQLILIGFGTSAHLVGFIGKYSMQFYNHQVYKIIALNPIGLAFTSWEKNEHEILSPHDALQVIVIYTETQHVGIPILLGSINVIVNNPKEGQPWCKELAIPERYICSHVGAIDIFLSVLLGEQFFIVKKETGDVLHGFPFDIVLEITGIFYLTTDENKKPVKEEPGFNGQIPLLVWPIELYPETPPESAQLEEFVIIVNHEPSSIATMYFDDLIAWLNQNPHGHVIIILINNEAGDPNEWIAELRQAIRQHYSVPTYIIEFDWSKYVFRDYVKTISYAKAIAREIAKWFEHVQLPLVRVTIIGFGTSAHVAGFVGKYSMEFYNHQVYKIIALNPVGLAFSSWETNKHEILSPHDASQVIVIYTETKHVGIAVLLGSINVIVNNPKDGQPWCQQQPVPTNYLCSHIAAIGILIESILEAPVLVVEQSTHEVLYGFPFEIQLEVTGVFLIETGEDNKPQHLPPAEETFGEGEIPLEVWLEVVYEVIEPPKPAPLEPEWEIYIDGILVSIISTPLDGLNEWLNQNPHGQLIIIITNNESGNSDEWVNRLQKVIREHYNVPTYTITINWSNYVYPDYIKTLSYAHAIAKELADWFVRLRLPLDRVIIIGDGTNAHVAGFIGKYCIEFYNQHVYKIIALNPIGLAFVSWIEHENYLLSPHDAMQVIVLYTETRHVGISVFLGGINVFINDPENGQPWCQHLPVPERYLCSHVAAIGILMESILLEPVLIVGKSNEELLYGFPFSIELNVLGIFVLITGETNKPQPVPPELWDPSDVYFIDPSITNGYDVHNLLIVGMDSYENSETYFVVDEQSDYFNEWEIEHAYAEVIMIITEQPFKKWAKNLRRELLDTPQPKYVIIVDWSMYVYKSYYFTSAYGLLIAKHLSNWITRMNIPIHKLEIIGFSTSAHVAGVIGLMQQSHGHTINRIVGLDPIGIIWSSPQQKDKLTPASALLVQVIHTNTRHFGYLEPLGHIDIYVNGGYLQPQCMVGDAYHENLCSHDAVILYYIESILIRALAQEAMLDPNGIAVISGDETIPFGYWLVSHTTNARVFLLETIPQGPPFLHASILYPPILEVEDPPYAIDEWPPINPDIFIGYDVTNLALEIYFNAGNIIRSIVLYVNDRLPLPEDLISTYLGMDPETAEVFLIINGEHEHNEDWELHLKDSFLALKPESVVIVLDWSAYKHTSYVITSQWVKPIGYKLAHILTELRVPFDRIHVIGFSNGAHIAGFMSEALQGLHSSLLISRITGLDPARHMWYHPQVPEHYRLNKNHAYFVDVIHTNTINFGFPLRMGHVDFYPNGGKIQPGCPPSPDSECSHKMAIDLFIQSLSVHAKALKVIFAPETKLIFSEKTSFATFGYFVEPTSHGAYYIVTKEMYPHLLQPDVHDLHRIEEMIWGGANVHGVDGEFIGVVSPVIVKKPGVEEIHRVAEAYLVPGEPQVQ